MIAVASCRPSSASPAETCEDSDSLSLNCIESRLFRAPTRCVARVVAYLFPRQGVDLGDRAEKEPGRARTCSAKLSLCTLIAGGAAVLQELQVQASFKIGDRFEGEVDRGVLGHPLR